MQESWDDRQVLPVVSLIALTFEMSMPKLTICGCVILEFSYAFSGVPTICSVTWIMHRGKFLTGMSCRSAD